MRWRLIGCLLVLAAGCDRPPPPEATAPPATGTRLLLTHAGPANGDHGLGRLLDTVRTANPDLILCHHLPRDVVPDWTASLQQVDPDYVHQEVVDAPDTPHTLVCWSRLPFATTQSRTDLTYRIASTRMGLSHGLLDVTLVTSGQRVIRLLSPSFKDKVFHPLGQTEMRRNESRLVGRLIRQTLEQAPDTHLVLLGSLQDDPGSAAYRELVSEAEPVLHDLRPPDEQGAVWTAFHPDRDHYLRTDVALVSAALLADIDAAHTRILPQAGAADSEAVRHRPLLIVLRP